MPEATPETDFEVAAEEEALEVLASWNEAVDESAADAGEAGTDVALAHVEEKESSIGDAEISGSFADEHRA